MKSGESNRWPLSPRTVLWYQLGRAEAIRAVAGSRAAFGTGLCLVLLTACARSHDQVWMMDSPWLWWLGPLGFSLVSGTWMFFAGYWCGALRWGKGGGTAVSGGGWRGFMGAYWMTAPVAWLYAVPVEQWLDSLAAARCNLWLLGIVSLWRVLLMTRVLQVVCRVPFARGLLWVLFAASIEVVAVYVAGPHGVSRRIMESMGGLRNSPEEDLLLDTLDMVAGWALVGVVGIPVALLIWRRQQHGVPFPRREPERMPWGWLAVAALAWGVVTVPSQLRLRRNHEVEAALAAGEVRSALDVMKRHPQAAFAAARPLPPKLHEWGSGEELGRLMAELRTDDPGWVHGHFLHAAKVVVAGIKPWARQRDIETPVTREDLAGAERFPGTAAAGWSGIVRGLGQSPEGRSWRDQQALLWSALRGWIAEQNGDDADWRALDAELRSLGYPAEPWR